MSSLVETLYPLPDVRRTPLSLLRWWESRRVKYNLVVGSAGMVTLASLALSSLLTPSLALPPLQELVLATLAYALLANACYTLGWVAEMVARLIWGARAPLMGPLLFREGLIFSVGLTLLPNLLIGLTVLLRILDVVAF